MQDKTPLTQLREMMAQRGIDIYLIPTSDFHQSEYVGEYFKARAFLTGFTGSAGTAVVTATEAGLWTDGRYYVQAEAELSGSGFTLYRAGTLGVPTIREYVEATLPQGGVMGFDGRCLSAGEAKTYREIAEKKQGRLMMEEDLLDALWTSRPALPHEPVWIFDTPYSGEAAAHKLARIREKMAEAGATHHLLASLYDIAWVLNLRGNDIAHVPVFLSFLLIGQEKATLFIQPEAIDREVEAYLSALTVEMMPYGAVYQAMADLPGEARLLLDQTLVNARLLERLSAGVEILDKPNPSELMKARKNETEIANTRLAHRKDGVAMTRFMYWLKTEAAYRGMTEYEIQLYLDDLRGQQEHFLDLSFEDICAYGSNGAMMHYSAEAETAAVVKPEGFLLVDSGGHYLEGTTDITRTFVLGEISPKMRLHYTTVLRSNLILANLRFLHGCAGLSMDVLCREPLWELGLDYRCGTGHGVGHLLNVHEGPNGFRYKIVPERKDSGVLEAGMITTDEPGVYLEGEYGIRIENELLCILDEKNEYGQFMRFENLTYCPIDLDGIDPELMTERERGWLNDYHAMVYEKIAPYLNEAEREWLVEYTRAI